MHLLHRQCVINVKFIMKASMEIMISVLLMATTGHAIAELYIEDGHVRELIPGATSTAAYMTMRNTGSEPLLLKTVTSPAANRITLHNTMNHQCILHMMGMDTLIIPAAGAVMLQEGAIHMMLEAPVQALRAGDAVELMLHFDNGTTQTVSLPVRSVLEP